MSLKLFKAANKAVRDSGFTYATDVNQHGVVESWDLLGDMRKGDCEDFALTQMEAYLELGGDRDSCGLARVATEVAPAWQILDHAVFVYLKDGKITHLTDNRFIDFGVMAVGEVRYRWYDLITPDDLKLGRKAKLLS